MSNATAPVAPSDLDAQEESRRCEARGFRIVPIPHGQKKPILKEWQRRNFTSENVDPSGNYGIKTSARLVDIDKDVPEAVAAGEYFLPPTALRHGRIGNRNSHNYYQTDATALPREVYADPPRPGDHGKKRMLIELRGDGCQTLAPGSTHPSGERVEWEAFGEPALVTAETLRRATRLTAAAAMLAIRWREMEGIRHDVALALAGFLARGGMPRADAEHFVEAVARVAGDDDWADRVRAVRDTYVQSSPTTGGPRLAELLGSEGSVVIGNLREWLGFDARGEIVDDVVPFDIFGDATLAGSPELPADTLPSVIAAFAFDTAARLGADPAAVALPALVVCAAAIDDRYVIQPRQHDTAWTESARLWLGLIAEPGEHKTPAISAALRPLRDAERRWGEDDRRMLHRYDIDRRVYTRALEAYIKQGGQGSAPCEPTPPPVHRLIVSDCTIEALSGILVDNPRGVLAYTDELSGWFGSFDAYRARGGHDRALWIEAYNGGPHAIDRIQRGRVQVPNWSVSIVGGIQPGPMRRIAEKITDDGMLQRFITAFLRPSASGEDRPPDHAALHAYHQLVFHLVDLPVPGERCVFTLSAAAQMERETVATAARNLKMLPDTSAALRGHLSKWEGLFARLLLTYHLIEAGTHSPVVDGTTARRVARFMLDYLLPNAARFYADVLGQEHLSHARWVAGHILAHHCERLTARDIGRASHELFHNRAALVAAMETLALAGWVSALEHTGKHPTRWRVNPRVHELFAERAACERERREAVCLQIAAAAAALGVSRGSP